MDHAVKRRVLFVYYTFTKQALKVTEDMESVFRDRGWETNAPRSSSPIHDTPHGSRCSH